MAKLIIYGGIVYFVGFLLLWVRFSVDQNLIGYLMNSLDIKLEDLDLKDSIKAWIYIFIPVLNILMGVILIGLSLISFEEWQEIVEVIKEKINEDQDRNNKSS